MAWAQTDRPKVLIHGRAIGASHARLARRWVSRLDWRMWCPLSALLTTPTQVLCQSGIEKQPRRLLLMLLQTTRSCRSIGPFDSRMAESARLMPVTASPMPAHAGAIAGLIS